MAKGKGGGGKVTIRSGAKTGGGGKGTIHSGAKGGVKKR